MLTHVYRPFSLAGLALLTLACGGDPGRLPAQDAGSAQQSAAEQAPSKFIRLAEDGKDGGSFQTAITSYEDDKGRKVDLVAAVHIADPAHYQQIQRELDRHGRVLYELVASPDVRPTPGQKHESHSPVSFVQRAMTRGLQLAFQLDSIDYQRDNFVHADLTPAGFEQEMEKRGQNVLDQIFGLMSREMQRAREQADDEEAAEEEAGEKASKDDDEIDVVAAFRRGEGRHALRLMFARQLAGVLGADGAPPPEEGTGTVLLEGRNEHAVEVLKEQLDDGQKDLAIYYGAAHMPGIERALTEKLGFRKTGQRWLVAWDLTPRPDSVGPLQAKPKKAEAESPDRAESGHGDRSK